MSNTAHHKFNAINYNITQSGFPNIMFILYYNILEEYHIVDESHILCRNLVA